MSAQEKIAAQGIEPVFPLYSTVNDTTPAQSISLAGLRALAANPSVGEKVKAQALTPYSADGKQKADALDAMYHAVVVDHDHDDLDRDAIQCRYDSFGVPFLAYTTTTHQRPDNHSVVANRWRVVIPLAAPVDAKQYQQLAQGIAQRLGTDAAQARTQQVFFAPNKADETAPYEFIDCTTQPFLNADDRQHPFVVNAIAGWQEIQRDKAAKAQSAKAKPRKLMDATQGSIIERVIQSHSLRDVLESNGYKRDGGDYLSPTSSSGNAGVHILERDGKEVCYSHHGESDPLSAMNNNGHALDVFDVLVILEHHGDMSAAVRALANKVDMEGQKERQREWAKAEAATKAAEALSQAGVPDLGDEQEVIEQPAPAFDNELPGRLADLQLAIFERMRKPSAIGSAMVALTVCGHLLGRRALGPTGLGSNLYSIICADTGRGKDALVGAPGWLMEPLNESLQATIAGQFSSRPALHEHLMDQPCTMSAIDEIGHMLKAIGNPRDSHMHDLGGFMMELFSAASKTINPRARRKAKGITDLEPVKRPHFSLVGATTPTMLGLALSSDMTAAGQLNRLLICCLDDWNGHRQKPKFGATPEWWGAWVESLHTTLPAVDNGGEVLRMTWTKDTESFFWAEEERRDDALQAEAVMVRELRQRDSEHALKIAQIVVLADHRTEVTRADLVWSFSFVDRLQWAVLDLCRREGILQGSSLDSVAQTAVEHLRKNGPKTEARLSADCRPFGATKSGDRQHVLRLMRESFGVQTLQAGRGQKLVVPK